MKAVRFGVAVIVMIVMFLHSATGAGAQAAGQLILLDKDNKPVTSIVDGNQASLRIELAQAVAADSKVDFFLTGVDAALATCAIYAGGRDCQTASFPTLGWFWDPQGTASPRREVAVRLNGEQAAGVGLTVSVSPRPVVMVHGFNSDFHAWDKYLGPQGFLAAAGLSGYAVGDGQVEGIMDTGSLSNPAAQTNSIAENAFILGQYIDNVQAATGAEKVDLLVHSMGGMISRHYLDRVMKDADVAQLVILGTPMAGSNCAALPAALGLLLPATIEIQPSYMVGIFNEQIFRRRGVPFFALAGTKLNEAVQSPCTPVPSDIVVTVDSVKAIPMPVAEMPVLHTDMTISPDVFANFVLPHLQTPPGKWETAVDPPAGSKAPAAEQSSKVYTGHVNPGETREVVIHIDPGVTVATFAMYDTTRTLDTVVTGASGKQIELSVEKNGLVRVDDPATLVYLGYGFVQPKPGKWVITVKPTDATPPSGADFAITAQFNGGAVLTGKTSSLVPRLNESVLVSAALTGAGGAAPLVSAQARLTKPDGTSETLAMNLRDNTALLDMQPDQAGIYGIEVSVTARTTDGFEIDRAIHLAIVVQPAEQAITVRQFLLVGVLAVLVLLIAVGIIRRMSRKKRSV